MSRLTIERAIAPDKTEEPPPPRPFWVALAWVALVGSLLPLGFSIGLPFQVGPADVLLPAITPVVLFALPRPRIFRLYLFLTLTSLVAVLAWGVVDGSKAIDSIQSWLFFWKSWMAAFLAYGLIMRSRDRTRSVHRVLGFVTLGLMTMIIMTLAGWALTGTLVTGTQVGSGILVTGFSAGAWDLPIQLYGHGQVNVSASFLALGGPVFAYRATRAHSVFAKFFWILWIPVSWWLIINSGSRGALVTAGLFMALLFLASERGLAGISVGKLTLTIALSFLVLSQSQLILDASPKYSRTIAELQAGNTETVTSGRDEINALSVEDILRSPLVGTAFGDFGRFHTAADTPWVSSSPHNTFLGAVHKLGIPLGVGYLLLMARTMPLRRPTGFRGTEFFGPAMVVPLAVGTFTVGDALTTPILAASILTISGAVMAARDIEAADPETEYD